MLQSCTFELQILKDDLQHAITRITESSFLSTCDTSRITTPSVSIEPRVSASMTDTQLKMLQELAVTARKRREAEMANVFALKEATIKAYQSHQTYETNKVDSRIRNAIQELRSKQREIRDEIRHFEDSRSLPFTTSTRYGRRHLDQDRATACPAYCCRASSHEPKSSFDPSCSKNNVYISPSTRNKFDSMRYKRSEDYNWGDGALNDILQVQFQLTQSILELEKSVAMRDSILNASLSLSDETFECDNSIVCKYQYEDKAPKYPTSSPQEQQLHPLPRPDSQDRVSIATPNTERAISAEKNCNEIDMPAVPGPEAKTIDVKGSLEKQVRFDETKEYQTTPSAAAEENEYSTPNIARNIMFDNIDEDEDEEKDSSLSFLHDNSICGGLSDESFVQSFDRLREEIGMQTSRGKTPETSTRGQDTVLDAHALQQKRIDICMEIQENAAWLAVSTTNPLIAGNEDWIRQRQQHLEALRSELEGIDIALQLRNT